MTRIPNASPRRAISDPIWPSPTTPSVASARCMCERSTALMWAGPVTNPCCSAWPAASALRPERPADGAASASLPPTGAHRASSWFRM